MRINRITVMSNTLASRRPPCIGLQRSISMGCGLHWFRHVMFTGVILFGSKGVFISAAFAQQAVIELPAVSISASRGERAVEDVPGAITIITAEEIERERVSNIRDLVRDEPAISVQRRPARFSAAGSGEGRDGDAGFSVRGLDGNRVLIQIDGIRIPNAFSFGATNVGRGDYVDLGSIARVEILRGPASALYGSDGLAGAVSFYTRSPRALLQIFQRDVYAAFGATYDRRDDGASIALTGAARMGIHEALVIANTRRASELRNFGSNSGTGSARTQPNPQELVSESALVKWVTQLAPDQHLTATFEAVNRSTDTDVSSSIVGPTQSSPLGVLDLQARDNNKRSRVTLQHTLSALNTAWADTAQWSIYYQGARSRQLSLETRSNASLRVRDQNYNERVAGVSTQASKRSEGDLSRRITYGLDAAWSEFVGNTDGTFAPRGESFPTKRFPDTRYNLLGIFVQGELGIADERLLLIPALRYDQFTLAPEASALFPSGVPAPANGDALTPKFGVVWKVSGQTSLFANLAQGFKAPAPNQVNQGFTNVTSNYRSIANPGLQPEKNVSAELGARKTAGSLSFEAAAFTGRYKNFIEQVQIQGNFTPNDPGIFQFVNLTKVRISGFEAKTAYRMDSGVMFSLGYAQVRGREKVDGTTTPLNTVNPPKLVAGIGYTQSGGRLGIQLSAVHWFAKKAADAPNAGTFLPPAATALDLNAHWRLNPHLSMSAGITNLTDKKYWQWPDVNTRSANDIAIDAYTQPPRSVSIAVKAEF
jgi:hemoglobin/transferrin/lactoferrin receptor protein